MKGRWILLLAGAGAAAAALGWSVVRGTEAASDALRNRLQFPPLAVDFPDALHRAVMDQLMAKYPGVAVSFMDPARGYRLYSFKTLQGIPHQIIYQADGKVFSQS